MKEQEKNELIKQQSQYIAELEDLNNRINMLNNKIEGFILLKYLSL